MWPDIYKNALERVGLNITTAASFFGVHRSTASRWGRQGPPEYVSKFLYLMIAHDMNAEHVNKTVEFNAVTIDAVLRFNKSMVLV